MQRQQGITRRQSALDENGVEHQAARGVERWCSKAMNQASRQVTPIILAYNEEPNLDRALQSLRWAERVVVLDSGSTDATESIAKRYPNVAWRTRSFDRFDLQSDYGIRNTGITSDYVLALDADMAVPEAFVAELQAHFLPGDFAGASIPFEFRIFGRPLISSILRAQLRLFKRNDVHVVQDGHGHKFEVDGPVYHFRSPIIHDDQKPLDRWIQSQLGYSRIEQQRIQSLERPTWKDRLRRAGIMPLVAGALAYMSAGGPLRGKAALHYAWQRVVYECLLSMRQMRSRP